MAIFHPKSKGVKFSFNIAGVSMDEKPELSVIVIRPDGVKITIKEGVDIVDDYIEYVTTEEFVFNGRWEVHAEFKTDEMHLISEVIEFCVSEEKTTG